MNDPYTVVQVETDKQRAAIATMHVDLFHGGKATVPALNGYWWLIMHKGRPVAFAGLEHSRFYKSTGYLCRAGVTWAHQGKGLQKRLIRVRLAKARRLGWAWAVSDTLPTNHPSANSLIRCGFKLFKPRRGWGTRGTLYWGRNT